MILVATKRPSVQQFVHFEWRADYSPLDSLPEGVQVLPLHGTLDAMVIGPTAHGRYEVWHEKTRQWLRFHEGDYLNVTRLDAVYPVSGECFAAHYDLGPRTVLDVSGNLVEGP